MMIRRRSATRYCNRFFRAVDRLDYICTRDYAHPGRCAVERRVGELGEPYMVEPRDRRPAVLA